MRAYGWASDGRTAVEGEAAEVRRWAAYLLDADAEKPPTWKGLAADLAERGVLSVSGRSWSGAVIRRTITAPRMIGKKFDEATGELVDIDVEPILDEATWQRLRAELLTEDRQKYTPSRSTVYLLSERLARCAECAHVMTYNSSAGGRAPIYGCTLDGGGCGQISINAARVEADVTERVLARLTSAQYRRQLGRAMERAGSVDDQRAVLADLEDRLAQLGRDYADRLIDRTTMLAGTERARANIMRAEVAIVRTSALIDLPGPSAEDILAWWGDADAARQHHIVAVLLDHVTVRSSEGRTLVGADRLEYHWRKL